MHRYSCRFFRKSANTVTNDDAEIRRGDIKMANSNNKKKSSAQRAKDAAKNRVRKDTKKASRTFLRQSAPFILFVVSCLLLVFFIAHIVIVASGDLSGAGDYPFTGFLGYGISYLFFGLFGHMAIVVPVAVAMISLFWKKLKDSDKAVTKTLLTMFSILSICAFISVIAYNEDYTFNFGALMESGHALEGNCLLGGLLGGVLFWLAKWGSVVILAIIIPILLCYLVGIQIHTYLEALAEIIEKKIKDGKGGKKKKKTEKRKYDYGEDDEDEDDTEEIPAKPIKIKQSAQPKNAREEKNEEIEVPKLVLPDEVYDEQPDYGQTDDDFYKTDTPVNVFDGESLSNNQMPEDAARYANERISLDAFNDEDYDDEIRINGRTPIIDRETGEVRYDDEPLWDETAQNESAFEESAQKETAGSQNGGDGKIVFDEDIKDELGIVEEEIPEEYKFPPIDLLKKGSLNTGTSPEDIESNKQILREVLESFRVKVRDISCSCGPTITRYEIKPDAGVRVRTIASLVDDISMALATPGVRIEAPIPGKAAVGVEVPNASRSTVLLRSLIETPEFQNHKSKLASCLGTDVSGKPIVFDIEKMPHLLVAGTTGSGKSVCINTIITSLLYRTTPDEVKLVLIDPKKVEFNVYRDIPHLSCKIVTDPKKAAGALNSAVNEMEKRFELIEEVGVRNITGYNEITKNDPDKPYMPRMVIIIDELADLMMSAPEEVETAICRIAQKARAAGIHLILGTQRPSVDVITGLIKANIPSRIAFTVTSSVDSRTIIDIGGAEKLIGMGDMLYAPVGSPKPMRVQGAFVSDSEVESIVEYIKENNSPVRYDCEFEKSIDEEAAKCGNSASKRSGDDDQKFASGDEDPKLYEALELAVESGKISTSLLQRKLEVGYGRAAKIIDRLEELGYVGPADGNKPRKILVTAQDLAEKQINDNDDAGIFD